MEDNASEFQDAAPDNSDGSDHSLAQFDLFTRYTALVEENLSSFCSSQGLSPSAAIASLSRETGFNKSDLSTGENVATAISALTSYAEFSKMMTLYLEDGQSPCVCPPLLNDKGEFEFE